MRKILLTFIFPISCLTICEGAELNSWINADGKAMVAHFIKIDGVNVIFENTNGKNFTYPLSDLNETSQKKAEMLNGIYKDSPHLLKLPPYVRSRGSATLRAAAIDNGGGDPQTEAATLKGLDWLVANQNQDGSWGKDFKCAMTGSSILAFLGHGDTTQSPKYGDEINNAALYLMNWGLKNKGRLWNPNFPGMGQAYTHAISTYGLAELYTTSKASGLQIPRLESVIRRAAKIIVDGQNDEGGWAYGYRKSSMTDLSVGGWQVQALNALHHTGLKIKGVDKALGKAIKCIKKAQDSQGAFKYMTRDAKGKTSMTAVGMLALQLQHQENSLEGKRAMQYNVKAFNNPSVSNYYITYYATQVFFLHGGDAWENYNRKFQIKLLEAQNADGSWSKPNAGFGKEDSQILATCWATLALEVYYRYQR